MRYGIQACQAGKNMKDYFSSLNLRYFKRQLFST